MLNEPTRRSEPDDFGPGHPEHPDHPANRRARFADDVRSARARYVPGTPEKYPKAYANVNILDAEAVLAALQKVEAVVEVARRHRCDDWLTVKLEPMAPVECRMCGVLAVLDAPKKNKCGEYHAEGLDQRGIYGGRSYP